MLNVMNKIDANAIVPMIEEELVAVEGGKIFGGPNALPLTPGKLGSIGAAFGAGWAIGTYLDQQFDLSDRLGDWVASKLS
jgi:hypothetical protein